jgi:predicted transcriptional regulator
MRKGPEGKVLLGFNAPNDMAKKIEDIARKRGLSITAILNEAVTEYIQRCENPDALKDDIRRALREEPALVAEAVQIYAARQLQKK